MNSNQTYTPEMLQARLNVLHKKLDKNRASIAKKWQLLFAPPSESESKVQMWVNQAERAVAVYDGVMMGYKLFRRFNGFFHLWGHKQKNTRRP